MSDVLLAVDPGSDACGVALFDGGELVEASIVQAEAHPDAVDTDAVETARRMALTVRGTGLLRVNRLVLEFPQTYGGRAARGDANDLFALAAVDGAIAALFPSAWVAVVRPHEWKGGVPKPKSARGTYVIRDRVEARLTAVELARVDWPRVGKLQWDVADAIGIGLWALGRFDRKRRGLP